MAANLSEVRAQYRQRILALRDEMASETNVQQLVQKANRIIRLANRFAEIQAWQDIVNADNEVTP